MWCLMGAFVVFVVYVVYRDWLATHKDAAQFRIVNDMLDRMMSQNWIDYINGKGLLKTGSVRYEEDIRRLVEEENNRQLHDGELPREVPNQLTR